MRFFNIIFILFACVGHNLAQTGGENAFPILNQAFSARSAALGNDFITARDQDINLGIQNPSLYNEKSHRQAGFNQGLLAGGINYGMFTYGHTLKDSTFLGASFRYASYGVMDRRDEAGNLTGKFYAGDFMLGLGASRKIKPGVYAGVNANVLYGQYEAQTFLGFSADAALSWEIEKPSLFLTAVVKNVGMDFRKDFSYTPAEIQFAIAHKVKHAPFRFSLLLHHLNRWDLTYVDPNQKESIDPLTGDTIQVKLPGFGEKLLRHFTYQVELILSKNIHLRAAYDYHRRQELKLSQRPGISGFSFGLGMYFKRFSLDYGIIAWSAAGYSNMISFTTNLDKWKR